MPVIGTLFALKNNIQRPSLPDGTNDNKGWRDQYQRGENMRPEKLCLVLLFASMTALAAPTEEALKAYDRGNYAEAANLLAPLVKDGDPVVQLRMGMLYYFGRGVKEDEFAAVDLWEKSAAQGNLDAMFQLGNAYTYGSEAFTKVPDPEMEAAKWYYKAGVGGHAEAQYSLGLMFLVGKGVVENREEALHWIKLAAAQGQAEAKRFLLMTDNRPDK